MASNNPGPQRETRRESLRIAFLVCLFALGGCATDSRSPDSRLGQTHEYWDDYQVIHPYDVQNPRGSPIDFNR
ncbi:MAG: hypothetical protein ACREFM_12805 [Hypericibacter sp.]